MNEVIQFHIQLLLTLITLLCTWYVSAGMWRPVWHISTVCKSNYKTRIWGIARINNNYIQFPAADLLPQVKLDFWRICAFPNVVGTIDCTHIKIPCPGGENAELFRNRKGFFSINVQAVSGPNLEFQNIVVRWPEAFTTPEYFKIVVYVHSLSIITWQQLITWLATNSLIMDFSNSEKYCLGWDIWHVCTVCVIVKIYVFPPYSF